MTTIAANTHQSISLDPEVEAFRALKAAICAICQKQDIDSADDARLQKLVDKYKDRYPNLTAESVEEELRAKCNPTPIDHLEICDLDSIAASALTLMTAAQTPREGWEALTNAAQEGRSVEKNSNGSGPGGTRKNGCARPVNVEGKTTLLLNPPSGDYHEMIEKFDRELTMTPVGADNGRRGDTERTAMGSSCWLSFKKSCGNNDGYNVLTYTFFLSSSVLFMFLTSVVLAYIDYSHSPYRDWALAGGVTSTSAQFRVRGPSSDDGKARDFVVSTNLNLAIEKDQITNIPVSYGDFQPDEHQVKRLEIDSLEPLTSYYYGITRPKRTPNSAEMAGVVGTFTTPAPEGQRMEFTIATGSCALTGSKSKVFERILDLDPLLFIHMGDFHYEDLTTLDIDERLGAYDKVMGSPTQRLLYMRTIFSYIWDDHDWLGNNQDSDYEEAASVAKKSYTIGIPHYRLGSKSANEEDAAKFQAFTIGTVRFIITDLRSESIKSSDYFSGRVYSKEQKEWLFDELSRAGYYDFIVWVTTRPWTDPEKVGSDSWGGFVSDRDELSAHIASIIGAGPRNLLVLSGDNHMVAFDDGSSTDYSGQDWYPGGFPLLHSGPLANFGSGLTNFFAPKENYFTDGCMAFNSEINHQFSTVHFYFPQNDDGDWREESCVRIRSYWEDLSNVIFEKEMCGELMRYGTPNQNTCTLKKLSVPTQSLFIAAAGLILFNGVVLFWSLGFNRCYLALSFLGLGILFYLLTIGGAVAGAFCFGMLGVNILAVSAFILAETILGSLFVSKAVWGYCVQSYSGKESGDGDAGAGVKAVEMDNDAAVKAMSEDWGFTHDLTFDDTLVGGVAASDQIKKLSPETVQAVFNSKIIENDNLSLEMVEAGVKADLPGTKDDSTTHQILETSIQAAGASSAPEKGEVMIVKNKVEEEGDDDSSVVAVLCSGENIAKGNVPLALNCSAASSSEKLSTKSYLPKSLATAPHLKRSRTFSGVEKSPPTGLSTLRSIGSLREFQGGAASIISEDAFVSTIGWKTPDKRRNSVRQVIPKQENEGVEVTNPTNRLSSAHEIRVSPSLTSL